MDLAQTEIKRSITLEKKLEIFKNNKSYIISLEGILNTTLYVFIDTSADKGALENDLSNIWYLEMATFTGDKDLPSQARLLLRQVNKG